MNRIIQGRRPALWLAATVAASALVLAGCSSTNAGGGGEGEVNNLEADIAAGSVGTVDQFGDIADICPTDAEDGSITLGVVDGGGTNSWSQTVLAEIQSEADKCAAFGDIEFVAGSFDLETTTSGITSLAAKGTDIILVIPDAGPGEAHLPAIRQATQAGSIVVNFASDPDGESGVDYLDYTDQSPQFVGQSWAQWVVDQLGDEGGNVVFLGGPAGVAVSAQEFEGIQEVFADNPQINLLTPEPVVTNWDPAQAQQAMAGLLSQGQPIDAVIADYGASAAGVIRAYEAAGLSVPLLTSTDDNSLSCGFADLKATNADYELATVSSRTWIGRVALRKALAAYTGGSDQEPSIYELALYEDSTGTTDGSITPDEACLPDAPPDATPSTLLTPDEITNLFG